jgi:hypothetical protein
MMLESASTVLPESDDTGTYYFTERFELKLPAGTKAALANLGRQKRTKPAEIARQAILAVIAAEGVSL